MLTVVDVVVSKVKRLHGNDLRAIEARIEGCSRQGEGTSCLAPCPGIDPPSGDMRKRPARATRGPGRKGGRGRTARARQSEPLTAWFVPSLAATLLDRERKKGSPLSRSEVIRIRDAAPTILVSPGALEELIKRRGYLDINPDDAWREWQQLRQQFDSRRRPRVKRAG